MRLLAFQAQRYCFNPRLLSPDELFLSILIKKAGKVLSVRKKVVPLQRISRKCPAIGVWCNGNTADSGPAFPGSSPGTPTEKTASS